MNTIPIYYFTASGNTKYCVQLVRAGFQDRNFSINLIEIKTVRELPFPSQNRSYPAIGLAFPVYEFMIPRIILIWLCKLLPAPQLTPVFIINTSGGITGDSAGIAMKLLRKKNMI